MLYPFFFFGTFSIVPAIRGSHKIAGNAADPFKFGAAVIFAAVAFGTFVVDHAVISAAWIAIYRMVDGAISNPGFLHAPDYRLKCLEVFACIAVELHITDVSGIGKRMVRRFEGNFR